LVGDRVFRDPQIRLPLDSLHRETRWLIGMMATQCLQIDSSEDPFARLRVIADGRIIVDIVFRVEIAGCRRMPVRVQCFEVFFILHQTTPDTVQVLS
jgi:hypothetical protein